ncbi:BglG family transcription antiterminator LicT [Paenibacillus massiliensis]|uniref:BglG family transcription antiterminator LicT n=1 Tax=Paenibacillus massiliensis TaxID=225917 RepID=UPI00037A688C|nr:PRD domain-containing protein [Paenibacillus massiliensis]
MRIERILNNNVIIVMNEHHKESVIMGKGIAFQKKAGDHVDNDKIEKMFTLDNKGLSEKLQALLAEIPMEHMEASEKIINYAKLQLGKILHDSIYVTLTDHISFAIKRAFKGMDLKNPLLWEVKRFYKEEFEVGLKALQILRQDLGVVLSEDEAAQIALHLVNAELNENMGNMVDITKVMHDVLSIVRKHFAFEYDEDSLVYFRFITHLKFFAQRLINGTDATSTDNALFGMVKEQYKEAFACVERIKVYIHKTYQRELTNEEMLYLTIHIERVVNHR